MVLCSMAVGLFVYYVRGGRLLCDDTSEPTEELPGLTSVSSPVRHVPEPVTETMRGNTVSAYRL